MGYLEEKYTEEYYLHRKYNPDGSYTPLNYGVLGIEEFMEGKVPRRVCNFLNGINFMNSHVLDIGFGRGEALKYARAQGARRCFGIDFSPSAVSIAKEFLGPNTPNCVIHLICSDVLEFLPYMHSGTIDVVIMLDVIEHLPRTEAEAVLAHVHRILNKEGILAIETPFYAVNEDLIAQNGVYIDPSPTDLIPETKGMHCNKFTKERFEETLARCWFKKKEGFSNLYVKEYNS